MTLATVANLYQQANHQSCYHHEDEAKEEPNIKTAPYGRNQTLRTAHWDGRQDMHSSCAS